SCGSPARRRRGRLRLQGRPSGHLPRRLGKACPGDEDDVRRRRVAAEEPTAVRTEEWPVAGGTPPPPVPPPDAAPGPPPGPPAGRVFAQRPGAGTQLKKKQTVLIDVSNGVAPKLPPPKTSTSTTATVATAPQVAVPDVKGKVLTEAGPAVEAAGLVPDTFPT